MPSILYIGKKLSATFIWPRGNWPPPPSVRIHFENTPLSSSIRNPFLAPCITKRITVPNFSFLRLIITATELSKETKNTPQGL